MTKSQQKVINLIKLSGKIKINYKRIYISEWCNSFEERLSVINKNAYQYLEKVLKKI